MSRRRPAAVAVAWLLAAAVTVAITGTADAAWSVSAQGSASAAALTMPSGNTPDAGTTGPGSSSVLVTWSPSTPSAGYEISVVDAITGDPAPSAPAAPA